MSGTLDTSNTPDTLKSNTQNTPDIEEIFQTIEGKKNYISDRLRHYKGEDKNNLAYQLFNLNSMTLLLPFEKMIEARLLEQYNNEQKEKKDKEELELKKWNLQVDKALEDLKIQRPKELVKLGFVCNADGYVIGKMSESRITSLTLDNIHQAKKEGLKLHEYYELMNQASPN